MSVSQYDLVSKIEDAKRLAFSAKETILNRLTNGYYNRICEMKKRSQVVAFLKADQDMYGEQAYDLLVSTWSSGILSRLFDKGGDLTSSDLDASIRILRHLLDGGVYAVCEADSYEIKQGVESLRKTPLSLSSWQVVEATGANRSNWRVYWHDNVALLNAVQQIEKELEKAHKLVSEKDPSVSRREAAALKRQDQRSKESEPAVYPEWLWFYWGEESIDANRSVRDMQPSASRMENRVDPVENEPAPTKSMASLSSVSVHSGSVESASLYSGSSGSSSYDSGGNSGGGGGGGD